MSRVFHIPQKTPEQPQKSPELAQKSPENARFSVDRALGQADPNTGYLADPAGLGARANAALFRIRTASQDSGAGR